MLLSKNSQVLLAIAWEAYSLLNPTVSSATTAVGCDPPSPAPVLPTHKGVYNISLLPNKQLVHELKRWVALLEVCDRLPSCISSSAAFPAPSGLGSDEREPPETE